MRFCPPNITIGEIWVNHGTSKCFMDTVGTSIIASYLFIFGSIQLWMYRKHGTTRNEDLLPSSKLYSLQIFFLFLVPLLSVLRVILQATILDDRTIYGYMVSFLVSTNRVQIPPIYSLFSTSSLRR